MQRTAFAGLVLSAIASSLSAAEQVGKATLIATAVTGDGAPLAAKSPVHRNERIKTSGTGLGEFLFSDGTKFAVGSNSSVVIDKFVYAGDSSVQNLTINAAKGSFRWISGGSKSSAYKIATPAGTIGIRGTAFDVFIGRGGATAVVLLKGSVQFCGANGCRDLRKRCDYIIATPGGGVSDPARFDKQALEQMRSAQAFPFMTGKQRLSRRFRVGSGCMSSASLKQKATSSSQSRAPQGSSSAPSGPSGGGGDNDGGSDGGPDGGGTTGKGNNGKGNGGGDGSPNGRNDGDR
ncbi:MAG: FecR domain-containing protein [Rhizobiaceae bacterium]|nr:FecR domain-containing protein [Rhizobiaceae bacterium]